jgi:hypothetical protein
MGGKYSTELPEGVDVETVTFISYSDGRPVEMIMAGTTDDVVRTSKLTEEGDYALRLAIVDILSEGGTTNTEVFHADGTSYADDPGR